MTITNTGNTTENNIVLTLPEDFSITAGNENPCEVAAGRSNGSVTMGIDNELAAGSSCDVTVTYTNGAVTSQTAGSISIAYQYNNGEDAPSSTDAPVNYRVTQSTATLSITPASHDFGNIVNNIVDASGNTEFTIANSGDIATDGTSFTQSITGTNSSLFSKNNDGIDAGEQCGNILAAGSSCKVNVKFGPTATAGSMSASLTASYVPYSGEAAATATSALSGTVLPAQSANLALVAATPPSTGFAGGAGTNGDPYAIQQSSATAPTISFVITNRGSVPATDFYVDTENADSNWTKSGTCGLSNATKITLGAAGSGSDTCMLTFTMTQAGLLNSGTPNLVLSNYSMKWTDQAEPVGNSKGLTGTEYVNVYAPATIAITPDTTISSPISVEQGGTITITATLSGGYDVPAQTIHAANGTGSATFSNSGDCTISSSVTSCGITATIAGEATVATGQTINITNNTNPSIAATPNPGIIYYDITQKIVNKYIFITSTTYNGDLKNAGNGLTGYEGADNICNNQAQASGSVYAAEYSAGARWKALLAGNNAAPTTSGITYINKTGQSSEQEVCQNNNSVNCLWQDTSSDTIENSDWYDEVGGKLNSGSRAWTGATPANIGDNTIALYFGWNWYLDGDDANSCRNWATGANSYYGIVGGLTRNSNEVIPKPWSKYKDYPDDNQGYLIINYPDCSDTYKLICIQQ